MKKILLLLIMILLLIGLIPTQVKINKMDVLRCSLNESYLCD